MKATITGDIVKSRAVQLPGIWLKPLKKLFHKIGETPEIWEIYRGDSFQIDVPLKDALRVAIIIKTIIKKQKQKKLDVRLAIGISHHYEDADRVSEATGEAFVYSGQLLDELKEKKINLGIKTIWPQIDKELNMMFRLALVIMNSWTSNTAEVAELLFSVPGITQVEIAGKLGIAQSSVNDRIKRGSVYEIIELEQYFRERLTDMIEIKGIYDS
jgi:hypothetical protein